MRALIGHTLLATLKPKTKPYEIWDSRLTGFLIRVQPTGVMTYHVEYARHKRIKLSRVGVLTPTQARDKARRIIADFNNGIDPGSHTETELTLTAYLSDTYVPWFLSHHRSDITWPMKPLSDEFGRTRLSGITAWNIEKWRAARLKKGLKPSTVNRGVGALKAALNRAVEWGLLEANPIARVKPLKTDTSANIRYLDTDEEARLRTALDKRDRAAYEARMRGNAWRIERGYKPLPVIEEAAYIDHLTPAVLVSLNTGLRRGELMNLKRGDINVNRAMLTIQGAGAKSGQTRHIPLNAEALEVIGKWMKQTKDDSLFPHNPRKGWESLLKRAGIDDFRWHDMRHHFASQLVMAGVDLNTVRELLGHSDMKMTLRYSHLSPEVKAEAVARLNKAQL